MAYEITATRKRPQSFEELVGQDFVSATLEASIASGHIAHAYLLSGPRGCGKTSTARILAKALNCEKGPTAHPCGQCQSCQEITRGASLDVIEIDGASNTSVDNVRQIKDEVLFPPNSGRYKIYIIDEVHMLSNSAFNALLKTIEEPPPYVVFIFATTELHKVPATIKSRCQQFTFRLLPLESIKGLLAKAAAEISVKADDDALLWIAKESGGSPRDAYTLFDQVVAFSDGHITAEKIRDKLGLVGLEAMNGLFECFVADDDARTGRALEALDAILNRGVSPEQLVQDSAEYCRALLLLKNGIDREELLGAGASAYSAKVLAALRPEQIEAALGLLLDLHRDIRFSVDPRYELELAMARLSHIRSYVSTSELVHAIGGIKRMIAGGAVPAGSSPAEAAALPGGSAGPAMPSAAEDEKKKPELPENLRAVFSDFAAIMRPDVGGTGAAGSAPAPSSAPAVAKDAGSGLPTVDAGSQAAPQAEAIVRTPAAAPAQTVVAPAPEPGMATVPADSAAAPAAEAAAESASSAGAQSALPVDAPLDIELLRKNLIESIGRSSPLLRSGLNSSLNWRIENGGLVIPLKNEMEESLLKSELSEITRSVAETAGRNLKVVLCVEKEHEEKTENAGDAPVDPEVALVQKVFRGQIVSSGKTASSQTGGGE